MLGADLYGAALVATIVWIILIYVVVTRSGRTGRVLPTSRRRFRSRVPSPVKGFDPRQNAEQQLLAVLTGSFEKRRLLNSGEYRAFKFIEDYVSASRRGYRVFAQ